MPLNEWYNRKMRRFAAFRLLGVGQFATALTLVSIASLAQSEGLEEETSRLVDRLNFKNSGKDFTFPAGRDEIGKICERLYKIGPEARAAIPTLIRALAGDDPDSSSSASYALSGIGSEAIPALRRILKEEDGNAQRRAVEILGDIGRDAASAIPDLVVLLRHNDPALRDPAIRALEHIDVASRDRVIGISRLLRHDDEYTREAAALALGQIQGAQLAFPELLRVASADKSPRVRTRAFSTLAQIDMDGQRTAEILADSLYDDTSVGWFTVGKEAAVNLVALRERAAQVIPTLIAMCNEDKLPNDDFIQRRIFEVFANNPELAAPVELFLRRQLAEQLDEAVKLSDDITVETCLAAADALLCMNSHNQQARDAVVSVLKDPQWNRERTDYGKFGIFFHDPRPMAAEIVARLEPPAREALPILKELMSEGIERQHDDLAATSSWAIANLDHNDATCIPGVLMYFRRFSRTDVLSESPNSVTAALMPRVEQCLPELLNQLFEIESKSDLPSKAFLVRIIVALGDDSTSQVINRSLKSVSQRPRDRSDDPWDNIHLGPEVLPLLGEHAKPAITKLLANLEDEDHYTRARSAEMLGRLQLDAPDVVPALVKRLKDERVIVRARAAEAIGRFGRDANSAVEPLQSAQDDAYLVVRTAARQSLATLRATSVD